MRGDKVQAGVKAGSSETLRDKYCTTFKTAPSAQQRKSEAKALRMKMSKVNPARRATRLINRKRRVNLSRDNWSNEAKGVRLIITQDI